MKHHRSGGEERDGGDWSCIKYEMRQSEQKPFSAERREMKAGALRNAGSVVMDEDPGNNVRIWLYQIGDG